MELAAWQLPLATPAQKRKRLGHLSNKLLFRAGLGGKFCFVDAEQP
jgi:hypothetical protein